MTCRLHFYFGEIRHHLQLCLAMSGSLGREWWCFTRDDASSQFVVDLLLYPIVVNGSVEGFCSETEDALKG